MMALIILALEWITDATGLLGSARAAHDPHSAASCWTNSPYAEDAAVPCQKYQNIIWRFPEMGVPLVIIHFRVGFSIGNQPFWGTSIYGNFHLNWALLVYSEIGF